MIEGILYGQSFPETGKSTAAILLLSWDNENDNDTLTIFRSFVSPKTLRSFKEIPPNYIVFSVAGVNHLPTKCLD